ncbi:MAG: hypothetical protein JW993_05650 [Sedimentisphaerales bacterium]|nr:hypothetical protein [Sedimentisphaerales bacterium]
MLVVLESFERIATRLSPIVLVVPGLILTGLGLCVWLGGLGFRRVLMGLVGALAGAALGYCLAGRNVVATVSSAVASTFVAVILQRIFAAVLLATLMTAVAFAVMAWPALHLSQASAFGGPMPADAGVKLSARESLDAIEDHWLGLATNVRQAAKGLSVARWAAVAVVGLGMLALGFIFRRLGGAMSCAVAGTFLVFSGLVLLLMFKGAAPVVRIESRPAFYGLVFAGMVGFGTLEQSLLCRRAEKRRQTGANSAERERGKSKGSWRDR